MTATATDYLPLRLAKFGLATGTNDRSEKWGPIFLAFVAVAWTSAPLIGFEHALMLLSTFGFLSALAGMFRPVIGLLGVGMLCTLDPITRVFIMSGGLFRWNSFNYLLVLAAIVALPVLVRISDTSTKALFALVLLMVLGLSYSPDPIWGIRDLLQVISAFGLLTYFARSSYDKTLLLWAGLVNGLLSGLGGLLMLFMQSRGLLGSMNHNAFSNFPLGGLFSICLACAFVRYRPRAQIELGILALLNISAVYLSGSRGGLLTGIACIAYIFLATRNVSARWLFCVTALLIGVLASTVFSQLNDRAIGRFDRLFDESRDAEARTSGRNQLMEDGWIIFQENLLGVGTGGYAPALAYYLTGDYESDAAKMSHSAWVKTLVENGVLGPILLGWYVASFTVVGWRSKYLALGILTSVALGTAFLTREFHGKNLWFLAVGATMLMNGGHRWVEFRPAMLPGQRYLKWRRPGPANSDNGLSPATTRNRVLRERPGTALG